MGNTIRFFEFRESEWLQSAQDSSVNKGHQCYAYRQADIWMSLARRVKEKFGTNAV